MIEPSSVPTEWLGHAAVALVVALILSSSTRSRRRRKHPVAPGALPILGHLLQLTDSDRFYAVLTKWADAVGGDGAYKFSLLGHRFVVLCSSDAVLEAMKLRPYRLRRDRVLENVIGGLGIHGVFTAEGKEWARQRKLVAPALNAKNVRDYFPAVKLAAGRLVSKWANEAGAVCALSDLSNHSLDVVSLALLGMDLNSLSNPESNIAKSVREVFHVTFVRSLAPVPYWKIPLIGPNLDGGRNATESVLQMIRDLVRDYRERIAANRRPDPEERGCLEKMVDVCDREDAKLDDEEVVGNLAQMVIAGADTTSNTIAFCLWEIAHDVELQAELRKEIVEAEIALDDLAMGDVEEYFPRLRSLVFEVLRVQGPAPFFFLEPASEPLEVGGEMVAPGTTLILMTRSLKGKALSEDPQSPNGKDPAQFCPRRWLVPEDEAKPNGPVAVVHPTNKLGGYMPFGHGMRICPGRQLAEVEILTTLIFVLQRFEVAPAPEHPPLTFVTRFTETFDEEMRLVFRES